MNFGVIGCRHGHIYSFIEEMIDLGHTFVGICEREGDLKDTLSSDFNVPIFSNVDELFSLNPEIIGTASKNNEKIDVIELCEEQGIHIIADKPIVINRDGLKRLEGVFNRGKIQVSVMFTERFNPMMRKLKEIIDNGEIGEVVNINFRAPHQLRKESREEWFFDKEENGGLLIDLLIHQFDALNLLIGSPVNGVSGYMKKSDNYEYPSFFDTVSVVLRTENGVIATMETDWFIPDSNWTWGDVRVFCTGTKGKVEIRTNGDPLIEKAPLGFMVTKDNDWHRIGPISPNLTVSMDLINRINTGSSEITHKDILSASKSSIIADEKVEKIV